MADNDKPRYSRISDILELLILMQSKTLGVTLADIQAQFNVSRRTAERLRDSIINILPQISEIEVMSKEKQVSKYKVKIQLQMIQWLYSKH